MSGFKNFLIADISFAKSPFYIKYGIPLFLLLWITILKLLIESIGTESPFLLYFALVIITARYFGERAAALITLAASITANYFFIFPMHNFTLGYHEIVQTFVFIIECSLIIGLTKSLSNAILRMRKSDLLFKAMIEKNAEAVVLNNADGNRLYCSPSIYDLLGYTTDEFLKLEAWELSHEEDLLHIKEQYYRLASHPGKSITFIHRAKHKNGSWVWIEARVINLLHEPLVNAMLANLSNVTERVILEKQRENFIGIASHELKTPLTSLKAYTQVLQNRFKNGPDNTSYGIVTKIDQQVSRIIQMITDLLDLTTFQAGKLTINKSQFDFNALVIEICENLQQTAKKHRLITELTAIAPLWGDRSRIGQVVTNLVSNAIKYSPNADQVLITSKIENEKIVLYIEDHGIGISATDKIKIFDRFYRVDYAEKIFEGLGLGLFICAQIVMLHGGEIGVESEEGQGSVFWFSLPLI